MKKILLTQGKFALIDDEDYEWLSKYKWCAHKLFNTFYAERHNPDNHDKIIKMHREILGLTEENKNLVDHKDRNGLNNQRYNLRIASHSINKYNCKLYKSNSSGQRGVTWSKDKRKWMVKINKNGDSIFYGYFSNIIEAAKAYDKAAIRFYGKDAKLNFPLKRRGIL